ncbi:uncharacterized protein LOC144947886 [Lampetra fluviatilis]
MASLETLSPEVLEAIFEFLDPVSLLRVATTCRALYQVCSSQHLWNRHCKNHFSVSIPSFPPPARCVYRALHMWTRIHAMLRFNPRLRDNMDRAIVSPSHPSIRTPYWLGWVAFQGPGSAALPKKVLVTGRDMMRLWGITTADLAEPLVAPGYTDWYRVACTELHAAAILRHGDAASLMRRVLRVHLNTAVHRPLEAAYSLYRQQRFQWLLGELLHETVSSSRIGGSSLYVLTCWRGDGTGLPPGSERPKMCDGGVSRVADMHQVTRDYLQGRLAMADEEAGIATVRYYVSTCRSLQAWLTRRDWTQFKRRKVYMHTLVGAVRAMQPQLTAGPVSRNAIWDSVKVTLGRVLKLQRVAHSQTSWALIHPTPYYELYLRTGRVEYLVWLRDFLTRKWCLSQWLCDSEHAWLREALSPAANQLLAFNTEISSGDLHGDCPLSSLKRCLWLYLHTGHHSFYVQLTSALLCEALSWSMLALPADPLTPHVGPLAPHVGPLAPHVGPLAPHVGPLAPHVGPLAPHVGPLVPHVGPLSLLFPLALLDPLVHVFTLTNAALPAPHSVSCSCFAGLGNAWQCDADTGCYFK